MSQESVELVRQVVEAFNRRDPATMTQRFDSEIVWRPAGPAAVERSVYRGRDEVMSGFAATWETWDVFHVEEAEVRDLGDSILWLGRARMRGEASSVEFDQEFAVRFHIEGESIVRLEGFATWQAALDATGPSE